jgi:hypothetical protein
MCNFLHVALLVLAKSKINQKGLIGVCGFFFLFLGAAIIVAIFSLYEKSSLFSFGHQSLCLLDHSLTTCSRARAVAAG